MQRALVIGGAGATGIVIVNQLLERGYRVAILHTGNHEPDLPDEVEHIHASPYKLDALEAALDGRSFSLVIATSGMLKHVTRSGAGKTERTIAVGGLAPTHQGWGVLMQRNPSRPTARQPPVRPLAPRAGR